MEQGSVIVVPRLTRRTLRVAQGALRNRLPQTQQRRAARPVIPAVDTDVREWVTATVVPPADLREPVEHSGSPGFRRPLHLRPQPDELLCRRPVRVRVADQVHTAREGHRLRLAGVGDGEGRVAFSLGRDLVLEPRQAGDPINFFIYPYVEVDGKTGLAKVEKKFSFKNL